MKCHNETPRSLHNLYQEDFLTASSSNYSCLSPIERSKTCPKYIVRNKQANKKKTYTHLPALISFVVIRGNVKEAKIHNNLFQYYFLLILIFILSFACLTRVCYLFMCLYAGHVCVYIYGFVFERKTHCWSQILCDVELFLHL